jgi:hypothetical protein
MKADGVLILSHCGFSFAEDLVAACHARNLNAWILTSKPLPEHGSKRLAALHGMVEELFATDAHELGTRDVENAIASLRGRGFRVKGCISVWEGYRSLMAYGNALQGIADIPWELAGRLRDKLYVRRTLNEAGLTEISAQALTPAVLDALKQDGGAYFVKPIHGIASYGAFRLTQETSWEALEGIAEHAQKDTVYTSVLGTRLAFMAEEYILGTEFSFEVLVIAGKPFVVGIHEKCQLTEGDGTVLENSCTSPPSSLTNHQIADGLSWIDSLLTCLKLEWGCFHIEARFDGNRWELIEVNPRVGGSLISSSVKALNGTASMLDLWLDQLVSQSGGKPSTEYIRDVVELSYAKDGAAPTDDATFFRVYFASPGRIASIRIEPTEPPPTLTQVLLKEGDEIEQTAREVFLGQILWHMPREQRDRELPHLLASSTTVIDVRYQSGDPL